MASLLSFVFLITVVHVIRGGHDCVRLTYGGGDLVTRDGRFMLCNSINDDSLDVECRILEEKPCLK